MTCFAGFIVFATFAAVTAITVTAATLSGLTLIFTPLTGLGYGRGVAVCVKHGRWRCHCK